MKVADLEKKNDLSSVSSGYFWTIRTRPKDMTGMDIQVACHKFSIKLEACLVSQRKKKIASENDLQVQMKQRSC